MRLSSYKDNFILVFRYFHSIFEDILSIITNTECIVCGKHSHGKRLCDDCAKVIDRSPALTAKNIGNQEVFYFGFYEDKLREFILAYKFKNHHSLSKSFAVMIQRTLEANNIEPDIITYVPATNSAKRKRGYDHMRLIAKELSRISKIPMTNTIKAIRETDQLRTDNRAEAVKGKYVLNANSKCVEGKRVLIIDDVLTTGNTISETVKVLKKANPSKIYVCVIALNKG
ncbi:ComF family protein [Fervidobacterium sp.]